MNRVSLNNHIVNPKSVIDIKIWGQNGQTDQENEKDDGENQRVFGSEKSKGMLNGSTHN